MKKPKVENLVALSLKIRLKELSGFWKLEDIFLCPGCSSGNRRETSPGTLDISPKLSASEIVIKNLSFYFLKICQQ
jgi:hypothetical protein